MPRSRTTTAETLERQAAADSKLGDLDEQGLERIPEFEAEHTNGHVPEGVRPSERCGTPSPLGIGCTFRDEHAGRHSWQPEGGAKTELYGHGGGGEAERDLREQPTLPGTPEPEPGALEIPSEASFGGKNLKSAPSLKEIAQRLIAENEEFAHLVDLEIRWFWRRRGGTKGGNPNLGDIKRPGVYEDYFSGGVAFLAWVAADHARDLKLTPDQIEAQVWHNLAHTATDPNDEDAYRKIGHDFEGFASELKRYGMWSPDLREMGAHIKQLALLDTLQVPALNQGDDADDGEDDEADE